MKHISHVPALVAALELVTSCVDLPSCDIAHTRDTTAGHVRKVSDVLAPSMPLWDAVRALDSFVLNSSAGDRRIFNGYVVAPHTANDLVVKVSIKTPDGKTFLYRHDTEGVTVTDGDSGQVLFASGPGEEEAPDDISGDPEAARLILSGAVQAIQ